MRHHHHFHETIIAAIRTRPMKSGKTKAGTYHSRLEFRIPGRFVGILDFEIDIVGAQQGTFRVP
jgi:hypothetical protein